MIYGLLQQPFNTIWQFLPLMNTSKPLAESEPAIVWSISYLYKVPRGSDQVAVARRLRWQG
jgi:hypothetical protein